MCGRVSMFKVSVGDGHVIRERLPVFEALVFLFVLSSVGLLSVLSQGHLRISVE